MSTSLRLLGETPYHHGDLRRALIDAALDQLADEGAASIGLREIARRVGVSPAAPYRHFRNRDALLAAVAAEGFARFGATLEHARKGRKETEQLAAMGQAYVRFARDHKALFHLMFAPGIDKGAHPELKSAAEAAFTPLAEAAARESAGAAFETAIGAWALVHGLSQLLIDEQIARLEPEHADALVATVTRSFVDGLRAMQQH